VLFVAIAIFAVWALVVLGVVLLCVAARRADAAAPRRASLRVV